MMLSWSYVITRIHAQLVPVGLLTLSQFSAAVVRHKANDRAVYGVRQKKSGPLNFFAVFSAAVWDFNIKFFSFIYWSLLHLTAK